MARHWGVVKWFGSKGQSWGYIITDEGPEIFVHFKSILPDNQENPKFRTLNPGQRVSFEVASGYYMPGTQAVNVKVEHGAGNPVVELVGGVG